MDTLALGPQRGLMDLIEEQLSHSKTIAVLGLSPSSDDPGEWAHR